MLPDGRMKLPAAAAHRRLVHTEPSHVLKSDSLTLRDQLALVTTNWLCVRWGRGGWGGGCEGNYPHLTPSLVVVVVVVVGEFMVFF